MIDTVTNTLTGAIPVAGGPVGWRSAPMAARSTSSTNYDQSVSVISIDRQAA